MCKHDVAVLYYLREKRQKAVRKAEVIDELPDKTEITRRIELTPDECVAYEAMRIEAQQQVAQATDRAYRKGQKRNVTVYHLIAADTIEEKILRLHKTKRDLADAFLQDQNTTHALTISDLKELLSSRS